MCSSDLGPAPPPQEDAYHQQYQDEVDQYEASLKASKAEVAQLRGDVEGLVDRVVATHESLVAKEAQVRAEVGRIRAEREAHEKRKAAAPTPAAAGPTEAECRDRLAQCTEAARQQEEDIADTAARARELEAAIAQDEDEIEALRLELKRARAAGSRGQEEEARARELQEADAWMGSLLELTGGIGGVRVVEASGDAVTLALTTLVGSGDDLVGGLVSAAPPRALEHTLSVSLAGGAVSAAELSPPTADLAGVVAAAAKRGEGLSFVVAEAKRLVAEAEGGAAQ